MFEMPVGISEGEALAKRKASRESEPKTEPTENQDVVDVSDDTPIEDVENVEQVTEQAEEASEIEESAKEESETETIEDEGEDLYVEYKGREISLKDIEEWEQGNLRQADYTRKTQELSESKKAFETEKSEFAQKQAELSEKLALLEVMTKQEELSAEELSELKEYDPERYIEYTEKQQKRKELLEDSKKLTESKPGINVQEEQAKLIKANPQWLSDGKPTEAYQKDMDSLTNYYNDNGFTQEQVDLVNTNALLAQAVIDAARYSASKKSNAVIEKKVRKAPVITKPKAKVQSSLISEIKALEKKVRQYGREQDFVKLRQLKRKAG